MLRRGNDVREEMIFRRGSPKKKKKDKRNEKKKKIHTFEFIFTDVNRGGRGDDVGSEIVDHFYFLLFIFWKTRGQKRGGGKYRRGDVEGGGVG